MVGIEELVGQRYAVYNHKKATNHYENNNGRLTSKQGLAMGFDNLGSLGKRSL